MQKLTTGLVRKQDCVANGNHAVVMKGMQKREYFDFYSPTPVSCTRAANWALCLSMISLKANGSPSSSNIVNPG